MEKAGLKLFLRSISFFCVLVTLIIAASYILAPKDNTKESGINNPNANGFFSEEKDTIDIAVIGNSDAYSGFSPMELWNKYGYTSYVSAEGHQSVAQSYSQLKRILECHKIKLLIVETDEFFVKSKVVENAAKMFNASTNSAFSVFQYHDRWKKVKPHDMLKKPYYTAHCVSKGQWISNDVNPGRLHEYMTKTDEYEPIPLSTKAPLDAILKTCKENNIEVMFLELPSQISWNYKKHNAVKDYADKNEIPFLDLNIDRDRFNFDWKTDTRDKGNHLNCRGARKTTLFIGEFISEKYQLTDHRNNEKYKQWNKDFKRYSEDVKI